MKLEELCELFTSTLSSRSHLTPELFTSTARVVHIDTMLTEGVSRSVHIDENGEGASPKCTPRHIDRKKEKPVFSGLLRFGGRNRTRTCDPIDVNDVLWAGGRVVKLLPSGVHMSQTS